MCNLDICTALAYWERKEYWETRQICQGLFSTESYVELVYSELKTYYGNMIQKSNNSMFLLRKTIEIGKSLISSAPQEFW